MKYYLGIDVGGTKTHALLASEDGKAVAIARGGPGNWEGVGYDGFTQVLCDVIGRAAGEACIPVGAIAGAGMGIGGYDWPSQREAHLLAISPVGLVCPLEIVNDASLGILAGTKEGWGVSIVAGTGCNGRGWTKDRKREGRAVGGASYWSDEHAGGYDIVARAMRAVSFEWVKRGPQTALTGAFVKYFNARDLDDLIEGVYLGHYNFESDLVLLVFDIARQGDLQALEVVHWAGEELGKIGCGVIHQLDCQDETIEVVLIGSLYDGHPLLSESLTETIHQIAPKAKVARLKVPPVMGGVLLGMEMAGVNGFSVRDRLIETTRALMERE